MDLRSFRAGIASARREPLGRSRGRTTVAFALVLAAAARAGEAPAPSGPAPGGGEGPPEGSETTGSSEDRRAEPDETPAAWRQIYEYIETIELKGGTEFRLRANVFVVVTSWGGTERGDKVRIELRPDVFRDKELTKADDPGRGRVTFEPPGGGEKSEWDLKPVRAEFRFLPGDGEPVVAKGLGGQALTESVTILSQGPVAGSVKSDSMSMYTIDLLVAGKPYTMKAEQRNSDLWVDWMLTGTGEMGVGDAGVQLAVSFVVPELELNKKRMKLASEAGMRYSSARPGAEAETTITTTLTYPDSDRGPSTYTRTCELRPFTPPGEIPEPEGGKVPPASKLLVKEKKGMAGRAGTWARSATLATLGTQRLAGVREAGTACWLAQVAVDAVAGREFPRAAGSEARADIARVAKASPLLEPPPLLIPGRTLGGPFMQLAIGHSVVETSSIMVNPGELIEETDDALSPTFSLSVMKQKGGKWRLGYVLDGMYLDAQHDRMSQLWGCFGIMGRVEYVTKKLTMGASVGPALVYYTSQSPTRSASGDLVTFGAGFDAEFRLGKVGVFADLALVGDGSPEVFRLSPGLRVYLSDKMALQAQMVSVYVKDDEAVGGFVDADGTGFGLGLLIGW